MSECKHMNFDAAVTVDRLEDSGRFNAGIRIRCTECNLPFQFAGLPLGLNLSGAAMSPDAQEARLAITPLGAVPTPLDNALLQGFRIKMPGSDH